MRCCLFFSLRGTRAIATKRFVAREKAAAQSREQNLRCLTESARPHSKHVGGTGRSRTAPFAALAPWWLRRGAKKFGSGGANAGKVRLAGSNAGGPNCGSSE